jgi:hypothetical protein
LIQCSIRSGRIRASKTRHRARAEVTSAFAQSYGATGEHCANNGELVRHFSVIQKFLGAYGVRYLFVICGFLVAETVEATNGKRVRIFTAREELPFAGHPTRRLGKNIKLNEIVAGCHIRKYLLV